MQDSAAHQQIGRFVVMFQHAEQQLTELLVLMANADDEFVRILVNELEYNKRVKATDVMFGRFVDLLGEPNESARQWFHELMTELIKLGKRRNEIVHSKYMPFINVEGLAGLRRESSKLAARKGQRDVQEEDLLPESFVEDLKRLSAAQKSLEAFRLKILAWLRLQLQQHLPGLGVVCLLQCDREPLMGLGAVPLRQVPLQIAGLMNGTPLMHPLLAEPFPQRLAQAVLAIRHEEDPPGARQATTRQVPEQRLTDLVIL
jgi:phenylpyruvate tautomerase PptA (4-oxalocrotonate tautomerase family)